MEVSPVDSCGTSIPCRGTGTCPGARPADLRRAGEVSVAELSKAGEKGLGMNPDMDSGLFRACTELWHLGFTLR